jgi:hypothetical protein
MQALHKDIGDLVTASTSAAHAVPYRIVGQVVLPTLGYPQALADGALMTGAGLNRIFDPNARGSRYLLARYAPGADRRAVDRRLATISNTDGAEPVVLPVEIGRVRDVGWMLKTLIAFLAAIALVAVGHAIITSVRRRQLDLATLKTLGFRRGQVRRSVAWQATILGAIGAVAGVPLGVVTGRLAWRIVADSLGVSYTTTTTTPLLAIALIVVAALVAVNLLALLPARSAARIRTAEALRAQ